MARRLTVESTDELGGIGQFGANDLDGDFPPEQRLGRPVDPAERPLPDRWTELVAAELAAVRRQLLSDRYALDAPLLQFAQFVGRLDADLVLQVPPIVLEGSNGVDLTSRTVERHHLLRTRAVAEGMTTGEPLEFADRIVVEARHPSIASNRSSSAVSRSSSRRVASPAHQSSCRNPANASCAPQRERLLDRCQGGHRIRRQGSGRREERLNRSLSSAVVRTLETPAVRIGDQGRVTVSL